ncbi:serine/threonine protein kinase [Actinomadura sp. CNU-125]|uniref:serine/threonine protein kinase n=1 Tax=Actinomadura sp. CNU-125 TaxID=1904961 RepID=UPI00291622FE|nr:serine/threonine protein kinase [Actinomadura sp. CNU-125]
MNRCAQPDCTGVVDEDGFCDVCGMAPPPEPAHRPEETSEPAPAGSVPTMPGTVSRGSRPSGSGSGSGRRGMLGAGLVEVPPVPARDPASAIMRAPVVPENRRFCSRCGERVGRSRGDDRPGRTEGYCPNCGHAFSFTRSFGRGIWSAGSTRCWAASRTAGSGGCTWRGTTTSAAGGWC